MTVRELMMELLDCDMNAKVQVHVGVTKGDIKERYRDCDADDDYVLDDECDIEIVEEYKFHYGRYRTIAEIHLMEF